jgi:KNR4/SMI1 homolog 2
MNNNIQSLWQKIQQSLLAIVPSIGESFQKPAEESQIKALEDAVAQPLPESFKEYLRTFNGQAQSDSPHYFMGYNLLLPTDEIIETYRMLVEDFERESIADELNPNKIQPVLWDKGWIPFTDFEATTRICIDLNPATNGVKGQVIMLYPGIDYQSDEVVLANSFEEFTQKIWNILDAKDYSFEEGIIEQDFLV